MRMAQRSLVVVSLLALFLPLSEAAKGAVSYTVGGTGAMQFPGSLQGHTAPSTAAHIVDGQGYAGDTVEMLAYAGMLELTPGTTVIQKINTLNWTVDWTYAGNGDPLDPDAGWVQLLFDVVATRSMSIGSSNGSVTQSGELEVNYDNDYLTFSGGPTSTFSLSGFTVEVTPIGIARTEATGVGLWGGPSPWPQGPVDVMAEFVITAAAVPEPGSLVVWSLLGLTIGGATWWRRRRVTA